MHHFTANRQGRVDKCLPIIGYFGKENMFEDRTYDSDPQFPPSMVDNTSAWLQTPPSQMPWGIPVANQPTVMRFTGDDFHGEMSSARITGITNPAFELNRDSCKTLCKRKSCEDGFDITQPNKQLITEEKMAANLNGLHISSNFTAHQFGSSMEPEIPVGTPTSEENSGSDSEIRNLPSLVMCEELRKLTTEPLIPQTLIRTMYEERPSTALVLWQPPAGNLCDQLRLALERRSSDSVKETNSTCSSSNQDEPKPSTSGLGLKRTPNPKGWVPTVDNNNMCSSMDLNLIPSTESETLSSDVPLPDENMMDL